MPKGIRKYHSNPYKREFGFKKGHVPHNKGVKYSDWAEPEPSTSFEGDQTNMTVDGGADDATRHAYQQPSDARVLRSHSRRASTSQPEAPDDEEHARSQTRLRLAGSGNRIVSLLRSADMWNDVMTQHRAVSPNCDGYLHYDIDTERQWGLTSEVCGICTKCDYRSRWYKMYDEVETSTIHRGRRAAMINRGVQIGLSQVSMGPTGLQTVLNSCNIPAPSLTSMQKSANRVLPMIEEENEKEMEEILVQTARDADQYQQNSPVKGMAFQVDGTYNNAKYTGVGKTPYCPATQVSFVVAENVSPKKKIVGLITKNKLCSKGQLHTSELEIQNCGCAANITLQTNIGDEGQWATEYFTRAKRISNIEATHLISDPDTQSHRAVAALVSSGEISTLPKSHTDTRHLGQNHRKFIKRSKALAKVMPGRTKKIREKNMNNFAIDMSKRCQAEFDAAFQIYAGDTDAIVKKLSYASDAIVKCYQGTHTECAAKSFVCFDKRDRHWLMRSSFLDAEFKVNCDDSKGEDLLRMMVEYRLGQSTVLKTSLNLNTQKVESVNKTIKRSLPSRITFPRNMSGRAHSAVHSRNNGPGDSLIKLCKVANAPIQESSRVFNQLKIRQIRHERHKQYKLSAQFRARRVAKRTFIFKLHERFNESKRYKKGQVLTPIANKLKEKYLKHSSQIGREHNYNKPETAAKPEPMASTSQQ